MDNQQLITLTASDLRGCDGGMTCKCLGRESEFHGVVPDGISVWLVARARQYVSDAPIQCHPSDYIRAWLGPVGDVLLPWADHAHIEGDMIEFYDEQPAPLCRTFHSLHCPAALASAMGSSVWRRTETGWEVVE